MKFLKRASKCTESVSYSFPLQADERNVKKSDHALHIQVAAETGSLEDDGFAMLIDDTVALAA